MEATTLDAKTWAASATILAAAAVALSPPAWAGTVHVHTQGFSFKPNELHIDIQDEVTWDNHDGVTHTVTDINCPRAGGPGPCEFDSVFTMTPGQTFRHTFDGASGWFDYKCTIHGFTGRLFVLDPDALPDLAIGDLTFQDASLTSSLTSKRIQVRIDNLGTMNSPGSKLQVAYFYQGAWHEIRLVDVPPVAAGGSRSFLITWTHTGKIGDFPIRASADHTLLVAEENESNNEALKVLSLYTPPGLVPGIDLLKPV